VLERDQQEMLLPPMSTMNAVVGDAGLKWKFGCAPTTDLMGLASEKERVTAHLEFAL